MSTEFEIIYDEFSTELDALSEIASPALGTALPIRSRIAAGNAATLLLAAIFEEFIRQQVKAAFLEKAKRSKANGTNDFPAKLASRVWKRSLEDLARTQFDDVEANSLLVEQRLAAVVSFSIRKDLLSDVSEAVAHNDKNMRPGQLTELFSQIGISNIMLNSCKNEKLRRFVGYGTSEATKNALNIRMEDFFRRRNGIAHAISLGSSSGPSEIHQDIEMFRHFGLALCRELNRELPLSI